MQDKPFIRIAGIAALITSLTTVGVHYVEFQGATFEDRLQLASNGYYIAHRWMIILHCLCVIISMLGLALLRIRDNRGFIRLGFLGYSVFGIAEIIRMFLVLRYLLPLRLQYLEASDESLKVMLQQSIDQFSLTGNALFSVFILMFAIGNLCYGVVYSKDKNFARWIGYGFLFWAFTGFLGMSNEFLQQSWIDSFMDINARTFQPLFRVVIGVFLLKQLGKNGS